jgi:hypothetical protein
VSNFVVGAGPNGEAGLAQQAAAVAQQLERLGARGDLDGATAYYGRLVAVLDRFRLLMAEAAQAPPRADAGPAPGAECAAGSWLGG